MSLAASTGLIDMRGEERGRHWVSDIWLWGTTLFFVALLAWGWRLRSEFYFVPDRGIGYALGVVGGSMMLGLLLYPMRKRLKLFRHLLSVRFWFRLHMVFGLWGPLCILYHCNFHMGSLNSNVALVCMLSVAASGLIGRYLYRRIHIGMYGAKLKMVDLDTQMDLALGQLASLPATTRLCRDLKSLREVEQGNVLTSGWHWFSSWMLAFHFFFLRRRILDHTLKHEAAVIARSYLRLMRRVLTLGYYERLFRLWHIAHLPLFGVLVAAATVHVFAVHIY